MRDRATITPSPNGADRIGGGLSATGRIAVPFIEQHAKSLRKLKREFAIGTVYLIWPLFASILELSSKSNQDPAVLVGAGILLVVLAIGWSLIGAIWVDHDISVEVVRLRRQLEKIIAALPEIA